MNVTIISNGFQEDYVVNILNNVIDKVDRVDLIGSSAYDNSRFNSKVNIYTFRAANGKSDSIWKKTWTTLQYFYLLSRYLIKTDSKVVHFLWIRFQLFEGVLLPALLRILGKKVVYTAHDLLLRAKDNRINRLKFKWIYRSQPSIIVHTRYIKETIVKEFKISPSKVHLVHHGVYERSNDPNITRQSARRYLGINSDEGSTIILFFGIIAEYKGLDLLVNSLNRTVSKPGVKLIIAGSVHPSYEKAFNGLRHKLKGENFLLFLRHIKDEEIEYFFKAADATVLPYKEASQSGVMFMSYVYGIPVIAPALGGFLTDVLPGKTGCFFEMNNESSLRSAITLFQESWPHNDKSRPREIQEFALANYSWDSSCQKMVKVYEIACQPDETGFSVEQSSPFARRQTKLK